MVCVLAAIGILLGAIEWTDFDCRFFDILRVHEPHSGRSTIVPKVIAPQDHLWIGVFLYSFGHRLSG